MPTSYTARSYRNPGRKNFSIAFRHPLKGDNGRPGRKVCKGLGTSDEARAKLLESQLNELLGDPSLHSLACRDAALARFDSSIVDIFYEDLDPATKSHRAVRERLMPLPREDGYAVTLAVGVTGSGKSTSKRRFIGTQSDRHPFPPTSVNRTTTCEIETITGRTDFSAVVTFLSRHQTQQEVTELVSNAVLRAIEGVSHAQVAAELLEKSDQRFRLKYVLGGWPDSPADDDDDDEGFLLDDEAPVDGGSQPSDVEFLVRTVDRIFEIGTVARGEVEKSLGPLDEYVGEDHDFALDEMQQYAEQSDPFVELVGDIMDEVRDRLDALHEGVQAESATGWPESWTVSMAGDRRDEFFDTLRRFVGTSPELWGQLLTPLVTGVRVSGPFRPQWVPDDEEYRHVFIDTEGLLHARTATEVPGELTSRFAEVDTILMVESAKNSLHSPAAAKVFEAVASTGYVSKFVLAFTHMDAVTGDDLSDAKSMKAKVFAGVRNVLDNHVARNVSREAARQLEQQLESNTFYLEYMDPKKYPAADKSRIDKVEARLGARLLKLTHVLKEGSRSMSVQSAVPVYSFESLGLAVQEMSVGFLTVYEARLGIKRVTTIPVAHWQSIKAMARRYAEGWFDGFWLSPIDTLVSVTRNVLTRFLEAPLDWEGQPITDDDKAAVINRLKQLVNDSLTDLSSTRLWKQPQTNWQSAYSVSGAGSTSTRKQRVLEIFTRQVPVPHSISDRWAQAWVDEIKRIVQAAVEAVRREQNDAAD
jgi:hypothetical protein